MRRRRRTKTPSSSNNNNDKDNDNNNNNGNTDNATRNNENRTGNIQQTSSRKLISCCNCLILFIIIILFMAMNQLHNFRNKINPYSHPSLQHISLKKQYLNNLQKMNLAKKSNKNFIVILLDDAGFDFSYFGSRAVRTPHIDALAENSQIAKACYSGSPVCTPSRATFMTGRITSRTGLGIFPTGMVLFPPEWFIAKIIHYVFGYARGLLEDEISIGDVMSAAGWNSKYVGKWHLGARSPHLPSNFGFENYFGTLYSNDMSPFDIYTNKTITTKSEHVDQKYLTPKYGEESVTFIEENGKEKKNFFLMLATNMPHDPLYVRDSKVGRSNAGLFGDVMEEIDEVIGNIMSTLKKYNIEDETMIWFTSDNGPWFEGWNGGYRERKAHYFEGGISVPCVVKWPDKDLKNDAGYNDDNNNNNNNNKTTSGTSSNENKYYENKDFIVTHQDMFATVLDVANIPKPTDRIIDGVSLLRKQETARSLYWHSALSLATMRKGKYKLHFQHSILRDVELAYNRSLGSKEHDNRKHMWLNNLELDPYEAYDVTEKHPDIAKSMTEDAMKWQKKFRNNPRGWK